MERALGRRELRWAWDHNIHVGAENPVEPVTAGSCAIVGSNLFDCRPQIVDRLDPADAQDSHFG